MARGIFRKALVFAEPLLTRLDYLFPFLICLYDHVFGRIQNVQVFLIKGLVKNTNYSITTLFIGRRESAYQLAYLAYSEIQKIVSLGKFLSCQIDPSHLPEVEIIAACAKKPLLDKFLKRGYLLLPYVSFSLNLRQSMGNIMKRLSRRRRRDIKKLENFGYFYTISRNNEKDFDFFYRNMYLPYTKKRFRRAAKFKTSSELKALYRRNGGIIFVKKEEKPISGILFQIRGETLYALRSGVYQGNHNFIMDLAGQAALFLLIDWAKMKGMKSLDYGSTLPFFSDGTFTYKKEWGMLVEDHSHQLFCALKINNINKGSLSFLQQNPFIFVDEEVMKGVVLINHRPTKVELQQIFSKYYLPKLDSLTVIAYHSSNIRVTNETEISTTLKNLPNPSVKSILSICLLLQKRGFNVEVYNFTNHCTHIRAVSR